jgi:sugar lactone lactonase YvrE
MAKYKLEMLADGFIFLEGPRWHDNQLWLSDMRGETVYTLTEAGKRTKIASFPKHPSGINFLPDGRVVIISMQDRKLMQVEAGGKLTEYVDLSSMVSHDINDSVCDAAGNIYVGNFGYDLLAGEAPKTADLIMVSPSRQCKVVASGLEFPNGAVITPDGRTLIIAETFGHKLSAFDRAADGTLSNRRVWAALGERTPDGICLDAEGAVWVASFVTGEFVRVLPDGSIGDIVATPGKRAVACNLGGADGRTLFGLTFAGELADLGSGKPLAAVEVCRVEVAAAGSP